MAVAFKGLQVKEFPGRTFAYIRNVGPYQENEELFGRIFGKMGEWVSSKGLMGFDKMEAISIYHDDPEEVPEEEHRISVGFTVPDGTEGDGEIQIMQIPEAKYAVCSFEVSPGEYGEAWMTTFKNIQEQGLKPTHRFEYEAYTGDPKEHPEGKQMVDICIEIE